VMLALESAATDASNADATGGEPVFLNGEGVGRVTSGAYGHTVGASLAIAYLSKGAPGHRVEVMVLGRPHGAQILSEPPFDPKGLRLRS